MIEYISLKFQMSVKHQRSLLHKCSEWKLAYENFTLNTSNGIIILRQDVQRLSTVIDRQGQKVLIYVCTIQSFGCI